MKFYDQPCNVCGSPIPRTGKRGRPPVRCAPCSAHKKPGRQCPRCGDEVRDRNRKFCQPCFEHLSTLYHETEAPF